MKKAEIIEQKELMTMKGSGTKIKINCFLSETSIIMLILPIISFYEVQSHTHGNLK